MTSAQTTTRVVLLAMIGAVASAAPSGNFPWSRGNLRRQPPNVHVPPTAVLPCSADAHADLELFLLKCPKAQGYVAAFAVPEDIMRSPGRSWTDSQAAREYFEDTLDKLADEGKLPPLSAEGRQQIRDDDPSFFYNNYPAGLESKMAEGYLNEKKSRPHDTPQWLHQDTGHPFLLMLVNESQENCDHDVTGTYLGSPSLSDGLGHNEEYLTPEAERCGEELEALRTRASTAISERWLVKLRRLVGWNPSATIRRSARTSHLELRDLEQLAQLQGSASVRLHRPEQVQLIRTLPGDVIAFVDDKLFHAGGATRPAGTDEAGEVRVMRRGLLGLDTSGFEATRQALDCACPKRSISLL